MKYEIELNSDGTVKSVVWGRDESGYYTTTKDGEGIFAVIPSRNDRRQLVGTSDFSVFGLTKSGARAKIARWMRRHEEDGV